VQIIWSQTQTYSHFVQDFNYWGWDILTKYLHVRSWIVSFTGLLEKDGEHKAPVQNNPKHENCAPAVLPMLKPFEPSMAWKRRFNLSQQLRTQLTLWDRILYEMPTVAQLAKKFTKPSGTRVENRPQYGPALIYTNLPQSLPFYFFVTHFNIILPFKPFYSEFPITVGSSDESISSFSCLLHIPPPWHYMTLRAA
jgi:hypothetical protein